MTLLGGALIAAGVALMLLAGVGILRFPDVLMRASVATKAAGLGVACVLAGVAFLVDDTSASVKLTLAVLLQFATAPLAGHVIGRGAYRSGAPLWEGTHIDDLRELYAREQADRADP